MKKALIYMLVSFHVFFTGNIGIMINSYFSSVYAEIGDIGHWRDSTGGQIPGTGFGAFSFNQEVRNDGIYSKPSNDTIELDEAGDYLIIATTQDDNNSNGRYNSQLKVVRTAGSGELFTSHYTGYSRNNSEDKSWTRAVSVLIGGSANARVQIQKRRDTDAPTGGSVAGASDVQVIKLDQTNYGIYNIGGSGNSYEGTTPNTVDVESVVSESNTSAIEGNIATNTVTLKGNNKKYLIAWSVSFEGTSSVRTQRIGHLDYDNTDIYSTRAYCYMRNNANEYCGLGSMDLLETSTSDVDVRAEVFRGSGVGVNAGGANSDGNLSTDGNGQMIVLEMPDYLEAFRSEDSTGGQNIALSQTLNIARDVNFSDALSFTKSSNTQVNVTSPADIFSWGNIWTARGDIASGRRLTTYGSITLGGVEQTTGRHGSYSRGNQATTDTFAMGFQPAGVYTTTGPGTTLGINTDPITGTQGGGIDNTRPGTLGFFALNLDTLVAPELDQSAYRLFANTNSSDVGITLAAQNTAATLSTDGEEFRLRSLISVTQNKLRQNEKNFKLQFAQRVGSCDTGFSGETYTDVTASSEIAFYNNATPADENSLTANANDPVNGATPVVNQSYQEANNFTTSVVQIPEDQDGKWDFSLIDNTAPDNTSYCFRVVESDGTLLDNYAEIPEITTSATLSCALNDVELEFVTDNWGYETFWSLTPTGNTCGVGEIVNGGNTAQVNCSSGGNQTATAGGFGNNTTISQGPYSLTVGNSYDIHVVDDYGDGVTTSPDLTIIQNGSSTNTFEVTGNGGIYSFTVISDPGCVDTTKPNVTVNQAPSQSDPAPSDNATFRAVFNESINPASYAGGISISGTTGTITSGPTEVAPNDGTTFEFTVTGMTSGDTVTASIPAGIIEDLAGNTNNVSTSTDNQVTYTPVVYTPGFCANYFTGSPMTPFEPADLVLERIDTQVNNNWGAGSPDVSIPNDNFTARWEGVLESDETGVHSFQTNSDDGIRLFINGISVINNWTNHAPTIDTGTFTLTAGIKYDIRLEYYEATGGAVAELSWMKPSLGSFSILTDTNVDHIGSCSSIDTTSPTITSTFPSDNSLIPKHNVVIDTDYSDEIDGSGINITPITDTVTNIAPDAHITATPNTNSWGPMQGTGGITNGDTSVAFDYHSDTTNAFIQFEFDTPQKIGDMKIYNRTGGQEQRLTNATIELFDSSNTLLYTHTLGNTTGQDLIDIDFNALGEIHGVSRLRLETTGADSFLNIREIELFPIQEALELYKWDGTSWGADIAYETIDFSSGNFTTTNASYPTNGLRFGKYRYDFEIEDNAGNTQTQSTVFYIDEPEFIISTPEIDMGNLEAGSNVFSPTVTVTIKTVGAGFDAIFNRSSVFTEGTESIPSFNGSLGYGYQPTPYSGLISPINTNQSIASEVSSININGNKNIYTYDIQVAALIDIEQAAGNYTGNLDFGIILDY